jgi:hypothetical protein
VCRRFLLPLIESPPQPQPPQPPSAVEGGVGTAEVREGGGAGGEIANQEAALTGPISELVAMGFDATASRNALLETGGNVEAAVGRLCR